MKKKILLVLGTRTEAIKMAPLYLTLKQYHTYLDVKICITASSREMLDNVIEFFELDVHYDLNEMQQEESLYEITSSIMQKMKAVLESFEPDYVVVNGNATTSMSAALAAFYAGCHVAQIESDTGNPDRFAHFPNDMNHSLTAKIADIHFVTNTSAKKNLKKGDISAANIVITGNTLIDALKIGLKKIAVKEPLQIEVLKRTIDFSKDTLLVICERKEYYGQGIVNICNALKEIAEREPIEIVYPLHFRPDLPNVAMEILGGTKNVHLIAPQPYESLIWLVNQSKIILTDNNAVQEWGPFLGKPILSMFDTPERSEAVKAGTVIAVGTSVKKIVRETKRLLYNATRYHRISRLRNPYGNGKASEKIVDYILHQ